MKRVLVVLLLLAGCGSQKTVSQPAPAIAQAWQARCGTCHARIEPHSRTHAELEAAFERHKSRAHLKTDEWKQLKDFLASDGFK